MPYPSLKYAASLPPALQKTSLGQVLNGAWDYISPASLFQFRTLQSSKTSSVGRVFLLSHIQLSNWTFQDRSRLSELGRVYFSYLFLYSGLEFTLSFFTRQAFGYDPAKQGRMYLFAGLIMILIQGSTSSPCE